MKIYKEGKGKRDCVSLNNYIQKVVDDVVRVLTNVRADLDSQDEFATAFNILLCKNKLEGLLHNLTYTGEDEE